MNLSSIWSLSICLVLDAGNGVKFEYLGWEGHVSVRFATGQTSLCLMRCTQVFVSGIVFHDIRFRGNRIVYELALQDQYVAYSGYAGVGQTVYMDSYYGLGQDFQVAL